MGLDHHWMVDRLETLSAIGTKMVFYMPFNGKKLWFASEGCITSKGTAAPGSVSKAVGEKLAEF